MSGPRPVVHGTWVRRSASASGSEPFETQHAVWVQSGTCYADIRVPFVTGADMACFAGRSGWEGPTGDRYRWTHHVDLALCDGDDAADLTWQDGTLVERGLLAGPGGMAPYVEVWVRAPGSDGAFLAMEAPSASLVVTGDHAATVVGTGRSLVAAYRVRTAGDWRLALGLGDGAAELPGPARLPDWPIVHDGTEVFA